MEKEDVLKIEFQPVFDRWAWRITYHNEEVLKRGDFEDDELEVYAKNSTNPFYEAGKLHLRWWKMADDDVMVCTTEEKAEIEAKVKAVNEKYGIVKRWRAEKRGKYYRTVSSMGEAKVLYDIDTYTGFDDVRYNAGNYFQTEEQCQKACDEINAIFEKNKQGGFE